MRKQALSKYMRGLVDRFFKILPLWEDGEDSLPTYLESLKLELLGFNGLINNAESFFKYNLISVLAYFSIAKTESFNDILYTYSTC